MLGMGAPDKLVLLGAYHVFSFNELSAFIKFYNLDSFMTENYIWFNKSKELMQTLMDWNTNLQQQINLIGLPEKTRTRHLQRYCDVQSLNSTVVI